MRWAEVVNETVVKLGRTKPEPNSPSMKMMDEIESTFKKNPMNKRQYIIGNAKVELKAFGNSTVRISDMVSMSKGSGTEALKEVCGLADKHVVFLELTTFGYSDTPTDVLVNQYKKFNFMPKDDELNVEDVDMIRHPK